MQAKVVDLHKDQLTKLVALFEVAMLNHFLDDIVAEWVVHQSLCNDLCTIFNISCLSLHLLRLRKHAEVVLYHFVVDLLFADACSLQAVTVVDVNQHLLNEAAALLVTTALSSKSNHVLETNKVRLFFALGFQLF